MRECEERVSANIDSTKSLLNFGLRKTDIDTLLSLSEETNTPKKYTSIDQLILSVKIANELNLCFKFSSLVNESFDDDLEDFKTDLFNPEAKQRLKEQRKQAILRKIDMIDIEKYSNLFTQFESELFKMLNYYSKVHVDTQGALFYSNETADLHGPFEFV